MFSPVSIDVISPENVAWVQGLANPQDTVEEFVETTRTMAEVLGLHIEMPRVIRVGFSDRNEYACALPGLIKYGRASKRLRGGNGGHVSEILHGLAGHELSHLSDYRTGNDISKKYPARLVDSVCEGKAELVGMFFGGKCYEELMSANLQPVRDYI